MDRNNSSEMFRNAQVGSIVGAALINNVGGTVNVNQGSTGNHQVPTIRELAEWLSKLNYRLIQKDNFRKHTIGTGKWILTHEGFVEWTEGEIRAIWITGMPGSGKTVLTAYVNDELQKACKGNPRRLALFAICRYDNKLSARDILAAVTRQIADSNPGPEVLELLYAFYEEHNRQGTTPDTTDFVDLFEAVFVLYELVTISFDALDEKSDEVREELLQGLSRVKANLFITSRPTIEHFKTLIDGVHSIRLESVSEASGDVELFIRSKMASTPRFRAILGEDKELFDKACGSVVVKCSGMFLLAALQLEELRYATDVHQLFEAIDKLPVGLTEMYEVTWSRIKSQSALEWSMARRVFLWILYRRRWGPKDDLLVDIACNALAVDLDCKVYRVGKAPPASLIESVCGGLVTVYLRDIQYNPRSSFLRLAHYTTHDFLQADLIASEISSSPHCELAATCIVSLAWLEGGPTFPQRDRCGHADPGQERNSDPLTRYAASHWAYHYSQLPEPKRKEVWELLGIPAMHPFPQFPLCNRDPKFLIIPAERLWDSVGPGHLAAYFGLFDLQDIIMAASQDRSARGALPIHYLCGGMPQLSSRSADDDSRAIQCLKAMLDRGVDVNVEDGHGRTPLMMAAWRKNSEMMNILLDHPEIDLAKKDRYGRAVLHFAFSGTGSRRFATSSAHRTMLFSSALDVNLQDCDGWTPFNYAFHGHIPLPTTPICDEYTACLLHSLISHPDFDVNAPGRDGRTQWVTLCEDINSSMIALDIIHDFLSRPRLEINQQDDQGMTCLHHLVPNSCSPPSVTWVSLQTVRIIEAIIQHPKIDTSIRDKQGLTALDHARKGFDPASLHRVPSQLRTSTLQYTQQIVDALAQHPTRVPSPIPTSRQAADTDGEGSEEPVVVEGTFWHGIGSPDSEEEGRSGRDEDRENRSGDRMIPSLPTPE